MSEFERVVLHTPSIDLLNDLYYYYDRINGPQYNACCNVVDSGYRLTLVGILDREELRVGISICNTRTDQFCKKYGVQLATARALVKPLDLISRTNGEWDKKRVLEKLKDWHMEIGNNLSEYKMKLHGVHV